MKRTSNRQRLQGHYLYLESLWYLQQRWMLYEPYRTLLTNEIAPCTLHAAYNGVAAIEQS